MAINISARPYQIFLEYGDGTNSFNVTAFCSGESEGYFVANESEPDERGLIFTTGKLVLDVRPDFITTTGTWQVVSDNGWSGFDVFQPDLNINRWAIGCYVKVYVAKDDEILNAGDRLGSTPIYSMHPKGRMRILKKPSPPYRGNFKLEIDIGDDLTLFNWRSPDDDRSGVTTGNLTSRTAIIGNLLSAAGIDNTDWVGTVGAYPLRYPIPKQGGSYIEQAGKVAIGGKAWLYQKNNGDVDVAEFDPEPGSAFIEVTLGEDEVAYQPLQGERPCSEVTVAGVGYVVEEEPTDSGEVRSYEYAVASIVPRLVIVDDVPVEPTVEDTQRILVKETIERWSWNANNDIFTRTISIRECRGLVVSDDFYYNTLDFAGEGLNLPTHPYTLVTSEETTEKTYYDSLGFEKRKEIQSFKPRGQEHAEYYASISTRGDVLMSVLQAIDYLALIDAYRNYEEYTYKGTQTREISVLTYETVGKVAGAATDWSNDVRYNNLESLPNANDFVVSQSTLQKWEPSRNITVFGNGAGVDDNPLNEWRKTTTERSAGTTDRSINSALALVTTRNEIRITNNGQDQPPAANTRKPDRGTAERQYKGVANLEPLADDDFAPRERTYRLDYMTSNQQCYELAEIFGAFLYGRHEGFQITLPFDSTWFDYTPMKRIDVINNKDITAAPVQLVGMSSGVTFVLGADKAVVTVNCLKLGILE